MTNTNEIKLKYSRSLCKQACLATENEKCFGSLWEKGFFALYATDRKVNMKYITTYKHKNIIYYI